MSTTTIRLPDDLKTRIAAAAVRTGTTSHNFILEAIAEKADQEEMRRYLEDRLAGKKVFAHLPGSWHVKNVANRVDPRG